MAPAPDTILVPITGRDIMPLGTIGGLLDMRTTGVPIGGTGTGEIIGGIGIDSATPELVN
jgi:hypothetical protein